MKRTISFVAGALLLAACATGRPPVSAEDAADAIAAAETARARAADVGYEWRDTAALIDQARKALENGHYATAIALASKAERQGIAAVRQYHSQKNASKRY